jgi:uncharacterized protein YdhG (YjbR/CyaY superfamily)
MPTRKITTKSGKKTRPTKPTATTHPKTVDDYIAAAPKERRAALTRLRQTIKAAAPKGTEIVSYGMVGFKQAGRRVAYFAYWKNHIALYGTSRDFLDAHAAQLKAYLQSKGTLQFAADRPLPYGLVTRIVKTRVAEIEQA